MPVFSCFTHTHTHTLGSCFSSQVIPVTFPVPSMHVLLSCSTNPMSGKLFVGSSVRHLHPLVNSGCCRTRRRKEKREKRKESSRGLGTSFPLRFLNIIVRGIIPLHSIYFVNSDVKTRRTIKIIVIYFLFLDSVSPFFFLFSKSRVRTSSLSTQPTVRGEV